MSSGRKTFFATAKASPHPNEYPSCVSVQLQDASGRSAAPRSPFAAIGARAAEPLAPCPQPCSRHGSGRDARGQPPAAVPLRRFPCGGSPAAVPLRRFPCGGSPAAVPPREAEKALTASQNVLLWLPAQNRRHGKNLLERSRFYARSQYHVGAHVAHLQNGHGGQPRHPLRRH